MQNPPSFTVTQNTITHTTTNTTPVIEDTANNGELIGKIIAMNLRNRLAQESEKHL